MRQSNPLKLLKRSKELQHHIVMRQLQQIEEAINKAEQNVNILSDYIQQYQMSLEQHTPMKKGQIINYQLFLSQLSEKLLLERDAHQEALARRDGLLKMIHQQRKQMDVIDKTMEEKLKFTQDESNKVNEQAELDLWLSHQYSQENNA